MARYSSWLYRIKGHLAGMQKVLAAKELSERVWGRDGHDSQ